MDELALDIDRSIKEQQLPLVVLPEALGHWWIDAFFERHSNLAISGPRPTWWWEHLLEPVEWTTYDGIDGLVLIENAISEWGPCVLIAVDESAPPAAVLLGYPADLIRLVGDIHFFEYIVVDLTAYRCLLDTHLNSFAVRNVGQPRDIPGA